MTLEETNKIIGKNIRALRLAAKASQADLGKVIGVTFQQIQKFENGTNSVKPYFLLQIADFFNCQVMDLYRGLIEKEHRPFDWDTLINRADHNMAHAYNAIQSPKQKAALLNLARTLSGGEG